jgi:RND family efflux transporter MFP subunit
MIDPGLAKAQLGRLIVVGICLLIFAGCNPEGTAQTPPPRGDPPAVSVANPVLKTIVEWDEYTARLEAVEAVDVRARVSGYLESINFTEGSVVTEGSLLFVIDPRPFEAELKRLQAEVKQTEAAQENARARFNRAKRLHTGNLMSEEEFQLRRTSLMAASADVQSAEATVEAARLNLEYTEVRAPISGRISRPFVTEGNLVQGGTGETTLLTTIVSLDPVHAYFEASERAYLKYLRLSRSGQRPSSREVRNPVYLSLADEEDFPHRGHMDFVDNLLDPNTGTMTGRAVFANPDQLLTPGLFARVRLPGSGVRQALLIPDAAIGSDQTERYVYVVGEDDVISYRKIEIGSLVHGLRVVRGGLQPEERIVINGLQRVRSGITVTPEPGEIELAPEPLGPEDAVPVQVRAVSRRSDGAR